MAHEKVRKLGVRTPYGAVIIPDGNDALNTSCPSEPVPSLAGAQARDYPSSLESRQMDSDKPASGVESSTSVRRRGVVADVGRGLEHHNWCQRRRIAIGIPSGPRDRAGAAREARAMLLTHFIKIGRPDPAAALLFLW